MNPDAIALHVLHSALTEREGRTLVVFEWDRMIDDCWTYDCVSLVCGSSDEADRLHLAWLLRTAEGDC